MAVSELLSTGSTVMLAGLAIQLGFDAAFAALVVHVHRHVQWYNLAGRSGLRRLLACVYASIALLTARKVYRVVEFAEFASNLGAGRHGGGGGGGSVSSSGGEGAFYGLDSMPVALTVVLLTVLHPGVLLRCIADGLAASRGGSKGGAPPAACVEAAAQLREGGAVAGQQPAPAPAHLHGC